MAVISGFFDAVLNGGVPDRKYSAEDFGAIFDGIISDGIFKNYPAGITYPFRVTAPVDLALDHLAVQVNPGRAWFDKTWTLNDSTFLVSLANRNVNSPRIDGIYIVTDKDSRSNYVTAIEGTPNVNPNPTIPADTSTVKYHLIAYVRVEPYSSTGSAIDPIVDSEITDMIGVDGGSPYVKSNVTDMNITTQTIIENLESQFSSYQEKYGEEFEDWFNSIKNSIGGITADQIVQVAEMVAEMYSTDYLSGKFPYVEGTALHLSSDKTKAPPVIINFGFVSASMSKNPNANEIEVITEPLPET